LKGQGEMTEEQIEISRRRFEIAGSIVCSMCFGLGLWMMSQPSLGPVKWLSLIPYIFMAACCYLSVFWLLDRYVTLPTKSIRLNWAAPLSSGPRSLLLCCPALFGGCMANYQSNTCLLCSGCLPS